MNTVIDGIITIDRQGTIQSFNPSAARIFGYTQDEVIGRNVKMLMPEPYHSEHDGYIRNYLGSGKGKVIGIGREVTAKRKNGDIFPMELGISEMIISGEKMFVGTIRDISDRKKIEQKLRESEKRYDLAVKGMGVGLWDWDLVQDKLYWSPTLWNMLGRSDAEFEPTLEKFRQLLHPDDRERILLSLNDHLENRKIFDEEYRVIKPDNSYIWIRACGMAVWSDDGKALRSVGSVTDITGRKKAEEELLRSNQELERFAYIASHDLQEPLRIIANFTALLESEYRQKIDGEALQYMNFIVDAAQRMQDMVRDLLEYSRIGYEDAGFSDVNCLSHTRLALDNLKEIIDETEARIDIGALPVIYANPVRFARLMQNLIGNGIKYRQEGRIPEISVRAEDRGPDWLFSVTDNGIGINNEYLEQIFIIFKRLHSKHEYKGTGIGLAVCKKIVESFDGRIWAQSRPGEGSTFYFTVPKKKAVKKPKRRAA